MASTHHTREKQKKGGVMYVYKLDSGNLKKPSDSSSAKKGIIHSGISWGLRRSKTVREVVDHGRVKTSVEDETKEIVAESRKSVSSEAVAGGRKSVSHLEVNVASVASFLQVKVLVTDMPGFMQVHAFRCARGTYDSLEKFSAKHMAYNIKKEFDKVYGPAWHCIVGSSFGSFVTHATGCFLYFSMEKLYILVFKTKVERALEQS
ncbi:unnamed protein product [Coffea canephora]|uniref:Dynein light chain n=1 Tax=Coffea canephora TaxID=49390 RepID=A0A068UPZ2_COFCA|nr:unnamed protein product [Coffea canephora]